jgi:uncharacterized protein YbjT (DUF2867 family)
MTKTKILITGASGIRGGEVVKYLTKRHSDHVDIVSSTANDPISSSLFADVQAAAIIPPVNEKRVEESINYIKVAKKAGVEFILLLSVQGVHLDDYAWGRNMQRLKII